MSPENAIFQLLNTTANAAQNGNSYFEVDVHSTVYTKIEKLKTVRVGNCQSEIAPNINDQIQEFDSKIQIQVLIETDDEDSASFATARESARDLAMATAQLLHSNSTLNGNACDLKLLPIFRGWATIQTKKYAAAILTVIVNPRAYGV